MGFLEDYFIRPTLEHTGYNLVNTVTYAVILIIALFAVYKILLRIEIKLDRGMWLSLLPFVFLGGALRALQDINFFGFLGVYHALFVTPMIYIIVFFLAFTSILVSKHVWKDFTRYFGIALAIISLLLIAINAKNPIALVMIAAMAASSYLILYYILKALKIGIIKKLNSYNSHVIAAHLLDAGAAFIAVSVIGGYKESSIFTSFLFSQLPGWVFIPIKASMVLLVLYFIDKENMDENYAWLIKFAILVLGLGPGLHDTFSVLMVSNYV